MTGNSRLMEMLTGYAAAHRHPWNVAIHMIGIPVIMFGMLIPLTWVWVSVSGLTVNLAHLSVLGLFIFYLTLDRLFAVAFLLAGLVIAALAGIAGNQPVGVSASIAAVAIASGYLAQFIGHAIEKSPPVILKHPVQANLAAPFFTVVEAFHILGFRHELFDEVQRGIAQRYAEDQ